MVETGRCCCNIVTKFTKKCIGCGLEGKFICKYNDIVSNAESPMCFAMLDQHRLPFLQLSEPAPIVIEPTKEDGLALKLDALA